MAEHERERGTYSVSAFLFKISEIYMSLDLNPPTFLLSG